MTENLTSAICPGICAECGGEMRRSRSPVPMVIRGIEVSIPGVEHDLCTQCGEVMLDLKGVGKVTREAIRQYKQAKGLLTADEIRALRQSLGLSQAAFEKLLGTGPKTVVRWEKGSVFQSVAADRLMRMLRARPELTSLLQELDAESRVVRTA